MPKLAIPLIHVANAAAAEEFYCNLLGFRREFAHRADRSQSDPCYLGISRDGGWVHVSSFSGDGLAGGVANFLADSVDALHGVCQKGRPRRGRAREPNLGNAGNVSAGRRWQPSGSFRDQSHPLGAFPKKQAS